MLRDWYGGETVGLGSADSCPLWGTWCTEELPNAHRGPTSRDRRLADHKGRLNRLSRPGSWYQPKINFTWLSLKSIIFSTISMESFEDSPDANRHGGYSILRELVANEWRSRLLHPRTRLFLCELRKSRPKGQQRSESIVPKP